MKITKKDIHKMIGEELESIIKEGFGGELNEKDRAEFEKVRMSNAEVLGYKLTGKPDVKLKQEDKVMFVVRKIDIQYKIPARFNDELIVQTNCIRATNYSLMLKQNILRDKEIITEGKVEIVCISADFFKPVRIPKIAKQLMEIL